MTAHNQNDVLTIAEMGKAALYNAKHVHDSLGKDGEAIVHTNQHGEQALRVDVEAEQAVIDILKKYKFPVQIVSEEHGVFELGESPQYLALLDGLDGSIEYKRKRAVGRYATMLGIFFGINPCYHEYVFCGIMEHSSNTLYFAAQGMGSFRINNITTSVHCSNQRALNTVDTRIYIDEEYDAAKKSTIIYDSFLSKFSAHNRLRQPSSAVHYADLASGHADAVLECTRKGNIEIGVAYGLVREAGGVIKGIDGNEIGHERYLSYHQDDEYPIVGAASNNLADAIIAYIATGKSDGS
jgi:fructose-1,6-bisphosphatase/inositol monophosphatase family enzyme